MKQTTKYTHMKSKLFKSLALLAFAGLALTPAMSQTVNPYPKTISVNGSAKTEVTPDEIYVQIELREYDKKGAGKVEIEAIKNNFLAVCKSLGLADTDLSVQAYSGWDGNAVVYKKKKKENPDLKAGITYWVKVSSTKKMDELVNKLDDEATQNFFIAKAEYSKADELKKQLKIEAIKAAKAKAIYLAEAIGEQVGAAVTINDPNEVTNYPHPVYANMMMKSAVAGDAAEPAMDVDFKKIKFEFEVNVVFALK